MGVNGKAPACGRGFLIYELIVGDWVELVRQVYLLCFDGVRRFGDLTDVFAGVFWGKILSRFWRRRFSRSGFASTPAFGRAEAPLRGACLWYG